MFSGHSHEQDLEIRHGIASLHSGISQKRKQALRKLQVYFRDVSLVDLHRVNWNLQYHRNNQTYRMLMFLCRLVTEGLLQSPQSGARRMAHFLDDQQMYQLYERFIREYYRQEFPRSRSARRRFYGSWMIPAETFFRPCRRM
ncbi:MAG: 5-methylcytosine restriction system specificity protein McrC [Lachnospiraceae bacterium]